MQKQANAPDKAAIKQYLDRATILLHSPKTTGALQKKLAQKNPVMQVAGVTVILMRRIDDASRAKGKEVSDQVRSICVPVIIGLVCELGEAARLFNLTPEFKQLAMTVAIREYFSGEIKAGRVDPAVLKKALISSMQKGGPEKLQQAQQFSAKLPNIAAQYKKVYGGDL